MKGYKITLTFSYIFCAVSLIIAALHYASSSEKKQSTLVVLQMLNILCIYLCTVLCQNIEGINHIAPITERNKERLYNEERTYIAIMAIILSLIFLGGTVMTIF